MDIITETKGRAAEYAPLQLNLYTTCTHGCTYCYCPGVLHKKPEEFHREGPPKKDVLKRLAKDCAIMAKNKDTRKVQLSFIGDPCQSDESSWLTHQALVLLGVHGIKATILTKAPHKPIVWDWDKVLAAYDTSLGVSIVWHDDKMGFQYEPGAPSVRSRMIHTEILHNNGIRTWVSLEPVIDPAQALLVIMRMHEYVDHWKVGIIQHDAELVAAHDWGKFYHDVTSLLDSVGADYYIKNSLKKLA